MEDAEVICCFSGHRPEKLPWRYNESDERCIFLKKRIREACESAVEAGKTHFVCGMAKGCDTYFAEEVFYLKARYPRITVEAAIPCREQAKSWSGEQRRRYDEIVSLCDVVTVLSENYTKDCMSRRNKYMVDKSSLLISVFDGGYGGTMQTVGFALKRGIKIIQIIP